MISGLILYWACSWLMCLAWNATARGNITVHDIIMGAFWGWLELPLRLIVISWDYFKVYSNKTVWRKK